MACARSAALHACGSSSSVALWLTCADHVESARVVYEWSRRRSSTPATSTSTNHFGPTSKLVREMSASSTAMSSVVSVSDQRRLTSSQITET